MLHFFKKDMSRWKLKRGQMILIGLCANGTFFNEDDNDTEYIFKNQ